jgi:hypothetical protein
MKMSETKPGDVVRFNPNDANNPNKNGWFIVLILGDCYFDQNKEEMDINYRAMIILEDSYGSGSKGDSFDRHQYELIFKDYEVIPLKFGLK